MKQHQCFQKTIDRMVLNIAIILLCYWVIIINILQMWIHKITAGWLDSTICSKPLIDSETKQINQIRQLIIQQS